MATHKGGSKQAPHKCPKERPNPPHRHSESRVSSPEPRIHADKENVQPRTADNNPSTSRPVLHALPVGPVNTSHDESATLVAVLQRLERMEAQLQKEQREKQDLEATVNAFHTGNHTNREVAEASEHDEGEPMDWKQKYLALEERLSDAHPAEDIGDVVPKPAGTCGKEWSLQVEMGLAGSTNKAAKYAALLRAVRDLVLNAGIKWEIGWKEIPASDKSKLFQVARERHPVLKRYANDWATAEIAKQYIKNKRAHYYNNGWLEVPEKYAYLKQNAAKRDPTGSRVKRAKVEMAAKRKGKCAVVNRKRDVPVADVDSEEGASDSEVHNGGGGEEENTV